MRKLTLLLAAMALAVVLAALPARADTTFVVDRTDDPAPSAQACQSATTQDCSLREAIIEANSTEEPDVIELGAQTYTLTIKGGWEDDSATGDLDIKEDLTIKGAGPTSTTIAGDTGFDDKIIYNGDWVPPLDSPNTTISGLTITGGSGPTGGGIYNDGTLKLTDSTITGNTADIDGGGIANDGGTLRVERSTISDNTAKNNNGGGVASWTHSDFTTTKTTITHSTISGNSTTDHGGGVVNFQGLTKIEHSTITNNSAPSGQGSGVASWDNVTSTKVYSSIISANTNTGNTDTEDTGTDVDFYTGGISDPTNSFVSEGYNLIGDGNATAAFNGRSWEGQITDKIGVEEPGLEPLALNGGSTKTHALKATSPALDRMPRLIGQCPPPFIDQRGVLRPQQGMCDIGSFERDISAPTVKAAVPQENATGIAPSTNVSAGFHEPMRATSINHNTFKLYKKGKGSTTALEATIAYRAASRMWVLNPEVNLERGATYKAVVTSRVKDLSGNRLDGDPSVEGNQPQAWSFKVRN